MANEYRGRDHDIKEAFRNRKASESVTVGRKIQVSAFVSGRGKTRRSEPENCKLSN